MYNLKLFIFSLKKLRGPEGGPERSPEGGVQMGGPGFVYTHQKEKKYLILHGWKSREQKD